MGSGAEMMVTLAAFDFVVSDTEVALMVTVGGDGTRAGAV
jgi:predicted polyphosphate/ATP-dependent NAD kinase